MRTPDRTTECSAPEGGGGSARAAITAAAPSPTWADAAAVGAAVAAYGLSYGVLAVAAGLSPAWATLSSLLVLAGGSQFAFVAVLAAGGSPWTGAAGGLLLNVRYAAFGVAIARVLPASRLPRRLADAYLIVDESVALALGASARGESAAGATRRFRAVGVAVTIAWIGATAVGAYGGQLLADPSALGLDAAFPAGFVALLAPWLRSPAGRRAAIVGAGLALAVTPLTPPGVPLLVAGLGALAGWRHPGPDVLPEEVASATDAPGAGGPTR